MQFHNHVTIANFIPDGKMTPSGHNWVQGQGAGPRLTSKDDDEEEKFGKS
jgi:hypothetical protein